MPFCSAALAHADSDCRKVFKESKQKALYDMRHRNNASIYAQLSRNYLRALCRIYFTDFLCARYPLPEVCLDIMDEVQSSVDELQHNIQCGRNPQYC